MENFNFLRFKTKYSIIPRIFTFNLESPAFSPESSPAPAPEPAPSDANYNSLIELSFSVKIQSGELNEIPRNNLLLAMFKGEKDKITKEIGRTEVFEDSSELDLFWSNKLLVKYRFGDNQPLILRLYHVYPENHSTLVADLMLHEEKLLAESSVLLPQIVVGMESTCSLGLENKQMRQQIGTLTVRAEETVASRGLSIKICTHMGKTNGISKKGQFLKVLKKNANGTANEICTTELVKNNPKPEWSVYLNMQQISGKGDELVIEGYNFSSNHNHTLFGAWQAPVSDPAKLNSEESSHGLKKNRNSQLSVDILESHSFLDFIKNGYEIGLMVAVDFAVTDVDPEGLDSFHNIDSSGHLNAYQQVLKYIGGAIEHYDSDRRFPAWCFGGKTNGKMLSCFNLDPDSSNCVVKGVEGILKSYNSALAKVKFHSPTSLSEVITKASSFVSESCNHNCRKYYVLVIVTSGDLLGIQETIDSLVTASNLPLSILIVGVGDDKRFEKMKKLCPGHLLKDFKGVLALRDIVRFMPKCNVSADERYMTCLEEIPKQFLTYMQKKGIKPDSI